MSNMQNISDIPGHLYQNGGTITLPRLVKGEAVQTELFIAPRNEEFRQVIRKALEKGTNDHNIIDMLTDEKSMAQYAIAFTGKMADQNHNYEVFEQLGDMVAGHFIKKYMYQRFPQLRCHLGVKVVARLLINYGSKASFFPIAQKLGFWPFISDSTENRTRSMKALLEDVFEAFIGVTEEILDNRVKWGYGYTFCYDLLKGIFDQMPISLCFDDLVDAKTRLKEIYDKHGREIGQLLYLNIHDKDPSGLYNIVTTHIYRLSKVFTAPKKGNPTISPFGRDELTHQYLQNPAWKRYVTKNGAIFLGEGIAAKQDDAQQKAADMAIKTMALAGYERVPPPEYALFSQKD